jgi:hypothetical protein
VTGSGVSTFGAVGAFSVRTDAAETVAALCVDMVVEEDMDVEVEEVEEEIDTMLAGVFIPSVRSPSADVGEKMFNMFVTLL